jgi:ubiquitin carboxyl-terminal hydrolase 5/13
MTLHQVDAAKHKIEKESALVVMPGRQRVPLPCPELPELVLSAIDAVVVSARQRALL